MIFLEERKENMAVHAAWPPLACLAMLVMMVAFIILKYGDKLCKARTVPKPQNYEIEDQSSENTTYMFDERESMREYVEIPEMISEPEKKEKYEIAV